MDLGTMATVGASAPAGVLIYKLAEKIIEKLPWGKFFSHNGKDKKTASMSGGPISRDGVKALISDHQDDCPVKTNLETMGGDIREIRSSVTQLLLNGRG